MAYSSSSSCTADNQWIYDVFVSFRGKDIRKGFMDHLFTDLKRKGIFPFRDDKQLRIGEEISPGLDKAIKRSRVLVVIFTKHYATSTWCLNELVQILECKEMDKDKREVRAIFYDVDKMVVRNHSGSYEVALNKHADKKMTEVPQWKEALTKAADLPGWDLQNMADGFEAKFVDMISKEIFQILSQGPLDVGENLVGLHSRVEHMNLLRFINPLDQSKVHMIGICGISGVGKTTIARAIYNLMHIHFEGGSFCEGVKGVAKMHGLPHVQKQLLDDITKAGDLKIHSVAKGVTVIKQTMRSKRVLVVLDDVSHRDQFKALAGRPDWFGLGSLIVVTGKDRQLLAAHGVEEIYEVGLLDQEESGELFSLYAFKQNSPKQEFEELSKRIVHYVNGHPLALKVLGCFLFGKSVKEWESEVDKLQMYPNFEIYQVLRLSYDGLDSNQQQIFLDIACFFRWEKPDFVKKILDACGLYSDTDIRVLVDKSLITISNGTLQLHDLLEKMGRQVVREESDNPGKRSRLWSTKDSSNVLNNDKGTEAVRGLILNLTSSKVCISMKCFTRMSNLRILKLYYTVLETPENGPYYRNVIWEDTQVDHSKNLEYLSNELRWLYWHGYPFEFLPSTFYPENLVALNMSYSNMKRLWTGSKRFEKLTLMELRYCDQLTVTPDFTEMPNLEKLFLECCTNLVELHPSVGILKRLVVLSLKNCRNLKSLPNAISSESLEILILCGCSKVDKLPDDLGNMRALKELHVDGTAITDFPSSVTSLNNLEALSFGGHKGRTQYKSWSSKLWPLIFPRISQSLPALTLPSLSDLHMIKNLDISHCNLSGATLDEVGRLSFLEKLNLSGNDFVSLPASFAQLSRLKRLGLVGCKNLQALSELPSSIDIIDATNCTSLQTLPSTMYTSKALRFDFSNCSKLAENKTIESLASMLVPQGRIDPYRAINMLLPGSKVPKWFTYRNVGDCVRVDLPQPWSYSKFKGFAACAVYAPKILKGNTCRLIEVSYSVTSFNNAFLCGSNLETRIFPNETRHFESDQVWLSYMIPRMGWEYRWENAKDYIDVTFDIWGIYCEVRECGVRLIYEEEEEVASSSRLLEWLPDDSDETDDLTLVT